MVIGFGKLKTQQNKNENQTFLNQFFYRITIHLNS